jgi:hypothetical protein
MLSYWTEKMEMSFMLLRNKNCLIMLLLFSWLLGGCSYIVNGVNDKISVNSNNPDTHIYVNGKPYSKAFGSVDMRRGEKYTIVGKAEGCRDTEYEVEWKMNALAVIAFPTFPFDLALGTAWQTKDKSIMINPQCDIKREMNAATTELKPVRKEVVEPKTVQQAAPPPKATPPVKETPSVKASDAVNGSCPELSNALAACDQASDDFLRKMACQKTAKTTIKCN